MEAERAEEGEAEGEVRHVRCTEFRRMEDSDLSMTCPFLRFGALRAHTSGCLAKLTHPLSGLDEPVPCLVHYVV